MKKVGAAAVGDKSKMLKGSASSSKIKLQVKSEGKFDSKQQAFVKKKVALPAVKMK